MGSFLKKKDTAADKLELAPWKILVVDDEESVHDITKLALKGFLFADRKIEFYDAFSAKEAKEILKEHHDIALILLDVVMESDNAGLELVEYIRNELNNKTVRIILRTGQAGQAPEKFVIDNFDINDYKEKTELTQAKLYTCVRTGLQDYARFMQLQAQKTSLSTLLQKFFENMNEGMMITKADGTIKAVNAAFTRVTGYTQNELVGQNPRILQSGEHSKNFYQNMWDSILKNGKWEGEIHNRRKNGETYPELLTIIPIRNNGGAIEHFVAIFFDLTALKNDQKKIEEQERMIFTQSRFAAMGEMIGMIAHQWRQPLTIVSMAVNNMAFDVEIGDIDNDIFTKHLGSISEQVQFLSHTIDDFRNFFKPSNKSVSLHIADIIDSALKIVEEPLANDNITLLKHIDFNPTVEVHESEMIQTLLAIITNAKDVMLQRKTESASIEITTTQNPEFDGCVGLWICDNGGGVPPDIIEQVFEPYFTTKNEKNGTGLGLYVAKTIIQKYQNGTIGVKNDEKGACFWIRLPLSGGNKGMRE